MLPWQRSWSLKWEKSIQEVNKYNRWSLCTDSRSSTQHMKEHAPLLESISWPTATESVNPTGTSGHLRKYRTEVEAGFHWFQGINEGITQFSMPRWMLLWGLVWVSSINDVLEITWYSKLLIQKSIFLKLDFPSQPMLILRTQRCCPFQLWTATSTIPFSLLQISLLTSLLCLAPPPSHQF